MPAPLSRGSSPSTHGSPPDPDRSLPSAIITVQILEILPEKPLKPLGRLQMPTLIICRRLEGAVEEARQFNHPVQLVGLHAPDQCQHDQTILELFAHAVLVGHSGQEKTERCEARGQRRRHRRSGRGRVLVQAHVIRSAGADPVAVEHGVDVTM